MKQISEGTQQSTSPSFDKDILPCQIPNVVVIRGDITYTRLVVGPFRGGLRLDSALRSALAPTKVDANADKGVAAISSGCVPRHSVRAVGSRLKRGDGTSCFAGLSIQSFLLIFPPAYLPPES